MPRSKWHSTLNSNQANQGLKKSTTRLTTKTEQLVQAQQKQVQHTITITTSSEKPKSIILMIQEPQQQEIIEIPLMSSVKNSLSENELLKSKIQDNNSQRKLIPIPQQNSKPRIFLLTKPSKPQLVRLETQTGQPQQKKILILSHPHQAQKIVATTLVTSRSQRKIGTTRIPFLPRSQLQTFSVKNNTVQLLKKDLKPNPVQSQNKTQAKEHTLPEHPIILEQVIHLSPSSTETNSNQLQVQQESVKNIIPKDTVNNLNLPENKVIVTKAQAQSEISLTLASMAGIELTGADMSLSIADMSGAMPPTATVEEINVPVFIDEYLQEATASTTSVTTNNFFNTNNNISNNNSNNNHSNETGNEVNNFLDTLDNFEFDINLLTENSGKDKNALEEREDQAHLHQQQQLSEVDENKKLKQHQMELQTMLEKILFNNYNNSPNNNNYNNNMADINLTDDLFKVSPYTEINDILSPDDMENSSFGTTQFNCEEAVDLNSISKDFTLDDCFINSQPTEIMFSSAYPQSQTSSQNLIHEISQAEPHIMTNFSAIATTSEAATLKMEECDLSNEVDDFYSSGHIVDDVIADCKQSKSLESNPLKRNSSQTNQHMLEKRRKLRLDTKSCRENVLSKQSEINTPKVIDFIDQFNDGTMCATAADSVKTIYFDLISSSPKCVSVKSEVNIDDTTNDFSPPNTPYSVNSISNQTTFMNTAPNSPASSIATTSNTSTTTKRGRGRPAKTHSDIPDRSIIQHLSETEQKKVLERAKNNEASRKSRLKHKERDNALEREEIVLKMRNEELEKEWEEWKKMEKKLKAAVKRQYFQFQNDQ